MYHSCRHALYGLRDKIRTVLSNPAVPSPPIPSPPLLSHPLPSYPIPSYPVPWIPSRPMDPIPSHGSHPIPHRHCNLCCQTCTLCLVYGRMAHLGSSCSEMVISRSSRGSCFTIVISLENTKISQRHCLRTSCDTHGNAVRTPEDATIRQSVLCFCCS